MSVNKFNCCVSSKRLDIEFENLRYTVKGAKGTTKEILKGVSGKFLSGQLTAIMGASGAGKTSLLNILTGFQSQNISGTIKCNGVIRKNNGPSHYKKESCYILQDDILQELFTVHESMVMATNLKIANLSKKSKEYLITEILDILGLSGSRNTRCKELSGGQKKRLSIALELIDNPPIMFLDEPTTGLDSTASTTCIRMLKQLAKGGRTIVFTIHQPSAIIYDMFDHVYVMAQGSCVFQGSSINTVPYLSSIGFHCPKYHNHADYLLEVANGDYGDFTNHLVKEAETEMWRTAVPTIQINSYNIMDDVQKDGIYDNQGMKCSYEVPSEWIKFCVLLKRTSLQIYRDWTISQLKLLVNVVVGAFIGLTFLNVGDDASKAIVNLGFLMIQIVYVSYTSIMPSVLKFPSEMSIIKKERFNNWYKLKTYYWAFLVFDVPFQILCSSAFTTVAYVISGQPLEVSRLLMTLSIQWFVALSASGVGLITGSVCDQPVNGLFWASIALCIMIMFAGFLVIFTHMNMFMYLFTYLCFTSFAIEGLTQAMYGYDRAPLVCPEETEFCQYVIPSKILTEIGMDKPNYWIDIGYLIMSFVVFRAVTFVVLKRKISTS